MRSSSFHCLHIHIGGNRFLRNDVDHVLKYWVSTQRTEMWSLVAVWHSCPLSALPLLSLTEVDTVFRNESNLAVWSDGALPGTVHFAGATSFDGCTKCCQGQGRQPVRQQVHRNAEPLCAAAHFSAVLGRRYYLLFFHSMTTQLTSLIDFRLPPPCVCDLRSSAIVCSVVTDVSAQPIGSPFSRVKHGLWLLEMGPIGCLETSVNINLMLRNTAQEQRSQPSCHPAFLQVVPTIVLITGLHFTCRSSALVAVVHSLTFWLRTFLQILAHLYLKCE